MRVIQALSLTLVLFLATAPAGAAEQAASAEARARLAERLARTDRSNDAFVRDARERAAFCIRCHGEDGNSAMPLVPNLAGQNAYYLLGQIEQFASGRRADYIMSPLARQLSPDDRAVVALYYAGQRPRPHAIDLALKKRGEARFRQTCVGCHGNDARGGEQYARLASQHPEYLRRRLQDFQSERNQGTATVMSGIARTLSDDDISALVAYLASLP